MLTLWGQTRLQLEDALKNRQSIGKHSTSSSSSGSSGSGSSSSSSRGSGSGSNSSSCSNSSGISLDDIANKLGVEGVLAGSTVPTGSTGSTHAHKDNVTSAAHSNKDKDVHVHKDRNGGKDHSPPVIDIKSKKESVIERNIAFKQQGGLKSAGEKSSVRSESNIDSNDIIIKDEISVKDDVTAVSSRSSSPFPVSSLPLSTGASSSSSDFNTVIEVKTIEPVGDTTLPETSTSDSVSSVQENNLALQINVAGAGDGGGDEMDIVDSEAEVANVADSVTATALSTVNATATVADSSTISAATSTSALLFDIPDQAESQSQAESQGLGESQGDSQVLGLSSQSNPVGAPVPSPVVPPSMPELPIPSPILLSSRKADAYLKKSVAVHQKGVDYELPGVLADGKLLWILSILRDPAVQQLLLKFLASRLSDMLKSKNASMALPRKSMGGMVGSGVQVGLLGAVMGKKILYPNDDIVCKLALQLCQLSMSNEHELQTLDQSLLRCEIPMVMLDVLCCSSDTSGMENPSDNDDKTDSLSNVIRNSSDYRQHTDIARHAIEACAPFRLHTSSCIPDNEMQLQRIYLESLAKHLLELNPPCPLKLT